MFLPQDNHITARGRLTQDPIININKNTGNVITTIRIAQETPFIIDGKPKVAFIDYVAIDVNDNKIGTRLADYVVKGSLVSIVAYSDSYTTEDDNGKKIDNQVRRISQFRNEESKEITDKRRGIN